MQIIYQWLLILAIFIFAAVILTEPRKEGLENNATDIMSSDSSITQQAEYLKYFKHLPLTNAWSEQTLNDVREKMKEKNPDISEPALNLTIKNYQKWATEEEANAYALLGAWPLNRFTINNVKRFVNQSDIPNDKKEDVEKKYLTMMSEQPNAIALFDKRFLPILFGVKDPKDLKAQAGFYFKTTGDGEGVPVGAGVSFKCKGPKPYFINKQDGSESEVTNFQDLTKMPWFKFVNSPCDPCNPASNCKFTVNDEIIPPYAAFWGVNASSGKAAASEVEAPNMEAGKLKVCLMKANKKIIDMGGEPEECL
jgi:hypothetical protein